MTLHGRPGLRFTHPLTAALLLALIPAITLAAIPGPGPNPTTEIVSSQTIRVMGANGQMRVVGDVALSGRLIVRIAPTTTPEQLQALLAETGCTLLHRFDTPGLVLLGLPAGTSVLQGVSLLQCKALVRSAHPDRYQYPMRTPNDPRYNEQYQWPIIHAPEAWNTQTGNPNITVAVVDTGVDYRHEDLSSRIWTNNDEIPGNGIDDDNNGFIDDTMGWDFYDEDNDPLPDWGILGEGHHGTHCAGLIGAAADNGVGITGHDWGCKIMPLKSLHPWGSAESLNLAAFEYAVANGADVISMSLGGMYGDEWTDPIANAHAQGVVVVAAAGNDSMPGAVWYFTEDPRTWRSPVCNDGPNFMDNFVIGVGATDDQDVVTWFSELDQCSREFIDVMAPGENILSTYYYNPAEGENTRYGWMSGTSMACPIVAGLASLVAGQYSSRNPDGVMMQIRTGCDSIDAQNPSYVGTMGMGRINSSRCVADAAPRPPRAVMAFDTPNDTGGSISLTWSVSLDDGRGFNDVQHYEVWRSTDPEGTFQHLGDLPKGSKGYVDASVTDYVAYYYQVYACDASSKTAARITEPAIARDDIAPDPVTVMAADTAGDTGGSISLNWSGYTPPADFAEYRVYRSLKSFSSVSEAEAAPTTAAVVLLARIGSSSQKSYQDRTTADDTDYYYAVTCVDTSQPGNEQLEVTAAGPERSNPNYAFAFPPGLAFIGIGLTMQNNEIDDVFDMSGTQFARWNPALGNRGLYVPYEAGSTDAFLRLMPGRGFWMQGARPVSLSLSGAAATGDVRCEFSVGWNQMANPYVGDVDVSAEGTGVRVGGTFFTLGQSNEQNLTRDYFWTYDSFTNSYRLISPNMPMATKIIRKGEGFFFLANRVGQLLLKNPNAVAPAAATAQAAPPADEWALRLVASIDGAADTDNFLGVSSRADQISGIASPPPATDGPDLYFDNSGVRTATAYVTSLGQQQSWTAQVACARPGAEIKLSWPDLSTLPADCRPMLTDTVSGRRVYMRTTNGYSFRLSAGESSREFTIEISTKAGDTLAIQSLQAQPSQDTVRISYALSAPAAVQVEIRNVAGRLVRRLGSSSLSPAGRSELLWNCASDSGQRVPSGRYLICLTGRSDNGQLVQAVQAVSVQR